MTPRSEGQGWWWFFRDGRHPNTGGFWEAVFVWVASGSNGRPGGRYRRAVNNW